MGDRFTVPDLIIGHCAGWAINAKLDLPKGKIADYVERVRSRDAFVRSDSIRQSYAAKQD